MWGLLQLTGAVCRVLLMLFSVVQIVVRNSTLFRIFSEHRIFRNKYYKWHTVQFEFFGTVVSLRLEVSVYSIQHTGVYLLDPKDSRESGCFVVSPASRGQYEAHNFCYGDVTSIQSAIFLKYGRQKSTLGKPFQRFCTIAQSASSLLFLSDLIIPLKFCFSQSILITNTRHTTGITVSQAKAYGVKTKNLLRQSKPRQKFFLLNIMHQTKKILALHARLFPYLLQNQISPTQQQKNVVTSTCPTVPQKEK